MKKISVIVKKLDGKIRRGFCITIIILVFMLFVILCISDQKVKEIVLEIVQKLYSDIDSNRFEDNLCCNKEFIGTTIWTLTTILFGFLILYYEMLGHRNFGLTNRLIISLICGSWFIPILLGLNSFIVCLMTFMFYMDHDVDFYLLAIYSFVLQGIIIFFCVYPTSQRKTEKVILKNEGRQILEEYNTIKERTHDLGKRTKMQFIQKILSSDELLEDKIDIISQILVKPFELRLYDPARVSKIFYEYFCSKFALLALYISRNSDERDKLYEMIYQTINMLLREEIRKPGIKERDRYCQIMNDNGYKVNNNEEFLMGLKYIKLYAFFGALFQSFICQKELINCYDMIAYILNDLIYPLGCQDKNRKRLKQVLIVELILCTQFLKVTGQISLRDEKFVDKLLIGLKKIEYEDEIEREVMKTISGQEKLYFVRIFPELIFPWVDDIAMDKKDKYELLYKFKQSIQNDTEDDFYSYLMGVIIC